MNTLHVPGVAPANVPACPNPLRGLAMDSLQVARTGTMVQDVSPLQVDRPLWSELLRFGLHGAALGMVTGLSIGLFNRIAAHL